MPNLPALIDRVLAIAGLQRAPNGGRWYWPVSPGWFGGNWGNGDRGPLGSWQRNMNAPHGTMEQIAFSAVYACIHTIASDIAKLPVQVFEVDLANGARKPRRDDYYVGLLDRPNDFQTRSDFIYCFVQSYLFQGNTYVLGRRNRRNEFESLIVLNPYRVRPMVAEDGSIFYDCDEDFLAGIPPGGRRFSDLDVVHHRLPLIPGFPLVGVTPIFAAAASSTVGLRILQNSQTFFGNASRPSGMLVSDQRVPDPIAARLKQEWDEAYRGDQYGKTALLSGGLRWEPLTITAQDAQLLEQLRWSVEDVARVFRVPPFMLGDMTKVSYRNTEQLARAYLTGCLSSHIEAIEARFARAFEFGTTFEFKFDLSALLRTEIDIRFTAYAQALNAGWSTINEVRAQEGLEPVEGGDEPHLQKQYVPLSIINEPPPEPAPAAPAPAADPAEEDPAPADEADDQPTDAAADLAVVRALVRRRRRVAA